MFYIGIDWSKDHHNMCIMSESRAVVSEIEYKQSSAPLRLDTFMAVFSEHLASPPALAAIGLQTQRG